MNGKYKFDNKKQPVANPNFSLAEKNYELTNHLGNVMAVVSDTKNTDGTANVLSANDYYPFGMQIPGREYSGEEYRYGFNGMERDNEIKGNGNSYSTDFRQYDPRLGRWLSLDPLMSEFPDWSPYVFSFDNPIWLNDPQGDAPPTIKETIIAGKRKSTTFAVLLLANKINVNNYDETVSFGTNTATYNETGKITLRQSNDVKRQVVEFTHELTNRQHIKLIQEVDDKVGEGKISAKQYAKQLAQIEVEGEINQIKVAADIDYRCEGEGYEELNKLIDDYSKDNTIDLRERVRANTEHLKTYEEQGKRMREDYLKDESTKNNTKTE